MKLHIQTFFVQLSDYLLGINFWKWNCEVKRYKIFDTYCLVAITSKYLNF